MSDKLDLLSNDGLEIPLSDRQTEFHLDPQSGMMVGVQQKTHAYVPADNGLGRRIVAATKNRWTR
jgi:hypothetical protein